QDAATQRLLSAARTQRADRGSGCRFQFSGGRRPPQTHHHFRQIPHSARRMKRLFFDCGPRDGATSLALFFLRAAAGLMMLFGHGLAKIENFATLKEIWHVPFLSGDIPAGARTASLIL